MRGRKIRVATLAGAPEAMGRDHGSAYAGEIRDYAADRVRLSAAGTGWSDAEVIALAEQMLPAHEAYDRDLYAEMSAMAEAAGLSAGEAVVVGGYTDFLDTLRAVAPGAGTRDECTAVIVPDDHADEGGMLAQTWDMNASATPHVVMLDLRPDEGPAALVFSTVGALGQIGMNEAGIAVGINNLSAADGRLGVTWPFVVRKALRQHDFDAAVACVLDAELAGGHNFLLFDSAGRGVSIEAMPTACHVEELGTAPLAHTNHCLMPATRAVEAPRPSDLQASSEARLAQAPELLGDRPVSPEALMALTRDERSICRRPAPPHDYESCGAAIMRPATGELWACWGVPAENEFERLRVGS
jgi:isopenicillin-N N-acyltransferase like protein